MSVAESGPENSCSCLQESGVRLILTKVSNFLTEQDIEAYVVGGLVRDVLLGRDTADIDLAIAADALEVAPRVAAALGGKYVLLDKVNRVGRVVLFDKKTTATRGQWELDFSTFKGDIEQDLARRDFTINALAVELKHFLEHPYSPPRSTAQKRGATPPQLQGLIDPFNGHDDLRRGVIRVVTETALAADAARLLRAVRLAAELGFTIDQKTETLIQRYSPLISGIAGERIREELLRLLAIPQTEQIWPYLDKLGLLTALFPELAEMRGVEQPKEHTWNVLEHSFKTMVAVDFLLREGAWEYTGVEVLAGVPWPAVLAEHFAQEVSSGSTRKSLLRLAALLHDIAKPQTKAIEDNGRIRFLGHAREGAPIAASRLEKLRFSAKEIKLVAAEIRHHLRPTQMSREGLPSNRAIYRYFRDTEEAAVDILFLSLADHLATRGPDLNPANWQEHVQLVAHVLSQYFEPESTVRPIRLVDGYDLIKIFTISPGPEIGEILETVREAQSAGELTTREEALAFIDRLLTSTPTLKERG